MTVAIEERTSEGVAGYTKDSKGGQMTAILILLFPAHMALFPPLHLPNSLLLMNIRIRPVISAGSALVVSLMTPRAAVAAMAACVLTLGAGTANAGGPVSKTFGGFKPGAKFTLKVTKIESTKLEMFVTKKCPIPKGVPNFKKGQKVTFTVGKKGEWTGPGINLAFVEDNGPSNNYVDRKSKNFNADEADVYKDTANKAVGAELFLHKEEHGGLGSIPVVYTVKYLLGK